MAESKSPPAYSAAQSEPFFDIIRPLYGAYEPRRRRHHHTHRERGPRHRRRRDDVQANGHAAARGGPGQSARRHVGGPLPRQLRTGRPRAGIDPVSEGRRPDQAAERGPSGPQAPADDEARLRLRDPRRHGGGGLELLNTLRLGMPDPRGNGPWTNPTSRKTNRSKRRTARTRKTPKSPRSPSSR